MADYVYATARIRSLESQLLTDEQMQRMTESNNIEDICKILEDAGYGSEGDAISVRSYEQKLKEKEGEIFEEIEELSRDDRVFDIFRYPKDYHNIKVLLKAEALGEDRSDLLIGSGTIPIPELTRFVNERDRLRLTDNMYKAVTEAVDHHARTNDPQAIDFICDKYCYEDINKVASESGSDFVKGYVALTIDITNLNTFFRVRKMGRQWPYFADLFTRGGNVGEHIFESAFASDIKQAAEEFAPYSIGEAAAEGGEAIEKEGTFTLLEKLCDDAIMAYVREAKFITFGIEAMVAYLVSRQMEIKSIRILMTGKTAKMKPEDISGRMRRTYE